MKTCMVKKKSRDNDSTYLASQDSQTGYNKSGNGWSLSFALNNIMMVFKSRGLFHKHLINGIPRHGLKKLEAFEAHLG